MPSFNVGTLSIALPLAEAEHPRWIGRLLSFYQTILEDGGPLPGRSAVF